MSQAMQTAHLQSNLEFILVHFIYFAFLRTDIFRMLLVTPLFAYALGMLHCRLMT